MPLIAQCYTVTGYEDFILIGHLPDMISYDDWMNARILTNPAISLATTRVVYRRVNFKTAMQALENRALPLTTLAPNKFDAGAVKYPDKTRSRVESPWQS